MLRFSERLAFSLISSGMGCYFALLKANHFAIQLLYWAGISKKWENKNIKKNFLKLGSQCGQFRFNVIPEFQIYRNILGSQMFSLKDCAYFLFSL